MLHLGSGFLLPYDQTNERNRNHRGFFYLWMNSSGVDITNGVDHVSDRGTPGSVALCSFKLSTHSKKRIE